MQSDEVNTFLLKILCENINEASSSCYKPSLTSTSSLSCDTFATYESLEEEPLTVWAGQYGGT